jgi:hypothetical protein
VEICTARLYDFCTELSDNSPADMSSVFHALRSVLAYHISLGAGACVCGIPYKNTVVCVFEVRVSKSETCRQRVI